MENVSAILIRKSTINVSKNPKAVPSNGNIKDITNVTRPKTVIRLAIGSETKLTGIFTSETPPKT